jgi:hypothetical protein
MPQIAVIGQPDLPREYRPATRAYQSATRQVDGQQHRPHTGQRGRALNRQVVAAHDQLLAADVAGRPEGFRDLRHAVVITDEGTGTRVFAPARNHLR